jgi:hypothetical protein
MIFEILDADGNVVNTIVATPEFMQENYPDGNYREVPQPPTPVYVITKFQFLMRFTATERQETLTAARTNVVVEDFMSLLNSAENVNVTNPETIAGVNELVSINILTQARADEILSIYPI